MGYKWCFVLKTCVWVALFLQLLVSLFSFSKVFKWLFSWSTQVGRARKMLWTRNARKGLFFFPAKANTFISFHCRRRLSLIACIWQAQRKVWYDNVTFCGPHQYTVSSILNKFALLICFCLWVFGKQKCSSCLHTDRASFGLLVASWVLQVFYPN